MKKGGCNPRWDRLAGAALRARDTLRAIIAKTAGDPALSEIHELAAERANDLRLALKHPERGL